MPASRARSRNIIGSPLRASALSSSPPTSIDWMPRLILVMRFLKMRVHFHACARPPAADRPHLNSEEPAIDWQRNTAYIRGHFRDQKHHRPDQLLGLSDPAERRTAHEACEPRRIVARYLGHRRLDHARRNRVDADSVACEVTGQRLGQKFH